MKKKNISYLTIIIVGLLMSLGVCSSKNILKQPLSEVIKILSDSFLLPAFIFCGFGILAFASNSGFFSMASYTFKKIISHISIRKVNNFDEKYKDYFEYYKEKMKEKAPVGVILFPGLLFFMLSVIFTVLYSYVV